jgi:transglutaminase-like putative cysteine protease
MPHARLERGGGWPTLILTALMLLSVAWAVQAAEWAEGLAIVQAAVLGGVLLGFLLALTRWEGLFPVLYSLLASIAVIASLTIRALLPDLELHRGVLELLLRNFNWFYALVNGEPSADNLIFIMQVCFLGWWLGFLAIWAVMRYRRVWLAVLPVGIAQVVNGYYAPVNVTGYLVLYLVAVLLLAIRVELARNESFWRLARVRYAPDIYLDFLRDGLIFTVVVIALAWLAPNLAGPGVLERLPQVIEEPWRQVQDTWQRMFTALNYRATTRLVSAFGKSMTLGGPVTLTDRPIFEAQTPERVYWRAVVFDTYTGRGWLNTDQETLTFDRNQPLPEPRFWPAREITATLRVLEARQDVIFGPPQPVRVTVPTTGDANPWRPDAEGTGDSSRNTLLREVITVSLLRSRTALTRNSIYQVVSAVSMAAPELLRTDSTEYPAWVTERYLQIPDRLPERVRRLARQITTPFGNPFDKATALETYLRAYPYDDKIAAPPEGMDGVAYFLFSVRRGYCDYYASAMAVMLRSVGIPARVVTGYTSGQYVAEVNLYQVQERNAHAWVEVFFPTYGWIQFEPTASEPLLARPTPPPTPEVEPFPTQMPGSEEDLRGLRPERDQSADLQEPFAPAGLLRWAKAHWPGLTVGAAALLFTIAALLWERRRRVRAADPDLALLLYGLLARWATRLRVSWPASHTPLEHATAFGRVVPEAEPPVSRLANLFTAQQYGRQQPTPEVLQDVAADWRSLQPLFWKRWLGRSLSRR